MAVLSDLWNFVFTLSFSLHIVNGGLLDSLLEGQQRGRGLQQGLPNRRNNYLGNQNQNQQGNMNLLNLFPQNRPGNELDPETREKLTEQKGKLEDILANLQELNRIKDEQRERENQELGNNVVGKPLNGFDLNTTKRPIATTTTHKPTYDDDDYKYLYNPNPKPKNNGWKTMNKKKFMFQAQPVRPQNEIVEKNVETVYFLD